MPHLQILTGNFLGLILLLSFSIFSINIFLYYETLMNPTKKKKGRNISPLPLRLSASIYLAEVVGSLDEGDSVLLESRYNLRYIPFPFIKGRRRYYLFYLGYSHIYLLLSPRLMAGVLFFKKTKKVFKGKPSEDLSKSPTKVVVIYVLLYSVKKWAATF